ncbi:MAG: FHA domain-containing protein [Elusimicrobiota bacterium]
MPKLLIKFNAAVIKEMPFDKESFKVGRRPDNDIILDNPAVSGFHCRIFQQAGQYFVEDANSPNGTIINDKKILKAGLHHNDSVGIVKYAIVFIEDGTSTTPPAQAAAGAAPAVKETTASKLPQNMPAATPTPAPALPKNDAPALLQVVEGLVDKPEYDLTAQSTYIGKSPQMQILIKGMFAPDVAAIVARRADGYYLAAVKAGYPKVNGAAVQEKQQLTEGDIIEVGSTKFRFLYKK